MKRLLMIAGLTIGCASCASTCSEDEQKPQTVKTGAAPVTSTMGRASRAFLANQAAEDAGKQPTPP